MRPLDPLPKLNIFRKQLTVALAKLVYSFIFALVNVFITSSVFVDAIKCNQKKLRNRNFALSTIMSKPAMSNLWPAEFERFQYIRFCSILFAKISLSCSMCGPH